MTGTGHVQFRFSLRLAAILLLGAISACGSSTENRRAMKSSGDAKQAATIKSTVKLAGPRADRINLNNLSYTISCPPKVAGKRGQSFQISAATTNLREVFRNATEDYDRCVVDLTSLHVEMTETVTADVIRTGRIDWTCDLNPSRGLRSISNPNVPSNVMLGNGPSMPSAIVAMQTCVPKTLGLTLESESRAIILTQPFPTDPLSKLQSEDSLIVSFEEATIPTATVATTSSSGSIETSPAIPVGTFPLLITNLRKNEGTNNKTEPVSPEFECVDLNAAGFSVDSSKLPASEIEIQTKNPWCTAVALRHAYAAVINCSSLNASSVTNVQPSNLLDPDTLLTLKFRHITDPVSGAISWTEDPPEKSSTKFSADLPFSGNFDGTTCVVLALPNSAPDSATDMAPNPYNGKYSFIYSPFHAEQPDPSTCLAGIPILTGTGSQYLSQVDFDSATTLGAVAPDTDSSMTGLPYNTRILKDAAASNSLKTFVRDAAIVGSYDKSCSRRALRFAQATGASTPSDTTTLPTITAPTFGLAVELSDDAKAAIVNAFKDELAPSTLKGLSLGFMHKPSLPEPTTTGTKFPIFGFGKTANSDSDKPNERLNGIYWQQKDYNGTTRWAVCLKLSGRDDLCVSKTLANDNNIAALITEKTFVALTMSRFPKEQDASRTVYISLYVNGKIGFFDGSGSKTAIEVSDAEARNFMNGISHFVVGANLEQTAHADADYNSWFAMDRPLTADEIRTVAQSIDGSIIPTTGQPGTTPLNKITLKVTTDGGTISGSGIPTCDPNKEITATFTPGTGLTLRATAKPGYLFKSWSGDCSGVTEDCTFSNIRADKAVSAAFDPKQAKIKIAASTGGAIAISSKYIPNLFCSRDSCGDVSFDAAESVKFTATPSEGYEFTGWTGGLCTDANLADCNVLIDPASWDFTAPKTLQASFATKKYTLTAIVNSATQIIAPDFAGRIKLDDAVITTSQVEHGTSYSLTAAAHTPKYKFKQWEALGPCKNQPEACTITPTGNLTVTAEFGLESVRVPISITGRGSVGTTGPVAAAVGCTSESTAACSTDVPYDGSITLTATPAAHTTFVSWSKPSSCGVNPVCTISNVGSSATTAEFSATFAVEQIAVTVARPEHATVTSADNKINCGPATTDAACTSNYDYDENLTVLLTAEAKQGYRFVAWDGCTSAPPLVANSCSVGRKTSANVTASFEALYKLSVSIASTLPSTQSITANFGSIQKSIAGGQTAILAENLMSGTSITVTLGSVTGYTCTSSGTTTITNADATITVNCTQNTYPLTLTTPSNGGIAVSSTTPANAASPYPHGTQVTINATAATGYSFGSWTGACLGITTSGCTVTMDSAQTVGATFTLNQYALTLTQPSNGTIAVTSTSPANGTSPYNHGTIVTVTATPAVGYSISSWTGTGACAGATATCAVTMDAAKGISAAFTQNTYALTLTPASNGSLAVSSTTPANAVSPYPHGTQVTITASAATGYSFGSWSGACLGITTSGCTVTMDSAKTVGATFTLNQYALTLTQPSNGTIAVTSTSPANGTSPYNHGTIVTVTATPAVGYSISSWTGTGACAGATATCAVTMDAAKGISATFTLNQYALTLTQPSNGTIAVTSTSPVNVTSPYNHGTVVTVTATPAAGYSISSWTGTGACAGATATCAVTMDAAKAVSATFTQNTYALTLTQPSNGTIAVTSTSPVNGAIPYNHGTIVTVTATPAVGYSISSWTGTGACAGATATCAVTMDTAKGISATFTQNTYALTLTAPSNGSLTVSSTTPANELSPYPHGTQVTITASAATEYSFGSWTGACIGITTSGCTVTMDRAKTVGATFTQNTYALTLTPPSNGSIAVSSTTPTNAVSPYPHGTQVTITASAATGYSFGSWTGACLGITTSGCTVTMDRAKTVGATFTLNQYALTLTQPSNGTIAVTATSPINATSPYNHGTVVTLTATPAVGYSISSWTGTGACAGATATCVVTMDAAKGISATFTQNTYALTLTQPSNGTIAVTSTSPVNGTSPYNHGTIVTVTATPAVGYSISSWTGTGACAGTPLVGLTCAVTMDAAKGISATFTQNTYKVSINATGPNTGEMLGIVYNITSPNGQTLVPNTTTTINVGNPGLVIAPSLTTGANYSVNLQSTPSGYTCGPSISSGRLTGVINLSDVTITIDCKRLYSLRADVAGLTAGTEVSVTLSFTSGSLMSMWTGSKPNGGAQTINSSMLSQTPYWISVTSPVNQSCGVSPASGTFASADVTVQIKCANLTPNNNSVLRGGTLTYSVAGSTFGPAGYSVSPSSSGVSITSSGVMTVSSTATPGSYTITAAAGGGTTGFPVQSLSGILTVIEPLTITRNSSASLIPGKPDYITQFTAGGGQSSLGYAFSIVPNPEYFYLGAVPGSTRAFNLSARSYAVAGTYTLTLTNGSGSTLQTQTASVTVTVAPPLIAYANGPYTGVSTTALNIYPTSLYGTPLLNCTTSPALPSGLSINKATCVISGTPSTPQSQASYEITATNAGGSGKAWVGIAVNAPTCGANSTWNGSSCVCNSGYTLTGGMCQPSCQGGKFYDGNCWYVSTSYQTCDQVCAGRGSPTSAYQAYANQTNGNLCLNVGKQFVANITLNSNSRAIAGPQPGCYIAYYGTTTQNVVWYGPDSSWASKGKICSCTN